MITKNLQHLTFSAVTNGNGCRSRSDSVESRGSTSSTGSASKIGATNIGMPGYGTTPGFHHSKSDPYHVRTPKIQSGNQVPPQTAPVQPESLNPFISPHRNLENVMQQQGIPCSTYNEQQPNWNNNPLFQSPGSQANYRGMYPPQSKPEASPASTAGYNPGYALPNIPGYTGNNWTPPPSARSSVHESSPGLGLPGDLPAYHGQQEIVRGTVQPGFDYDYALRGQYAVGPSQPVDTPYGVAHGGGAAAASRPDQFSQNFPRTTTNRFGSPITTPSPGTPTRAGVTTPNHAVGPSPGGNPSTPGTPTHVPITRQLPTPPEQKTGMWGYEPNLPGTPPPLAPFHHMSPSPDFGGSHGMRTPAQHQYHSPPTSTPPASAMAHGFYPPQHVPPTSKFSSSLHIQIQTTSEGTRPKAPSPLGTQGGQRMDKYPPHGMYNGGGSNHPNKQTYSSTVKTLPGYSPFPAQYATATSFHPKPTTIPESPSISQPWVVSVCNPPYPTLVTGQQPPRGMPDPSELNYPLQQGADVIPGNPFIASLPPGCGHSHRSGSTGSEDMAYTQGGYNILQNI